VQAGVFLYDTTQLKIMTQQHPITPPPELVQQWDTEGRHQDYCTVTEHIATRAAQWGADQELEACIDWTANARNSGMGWDIATSLSGDLRAARRPKPSSLKEQALEMLESAWEGGHINNNAAQTIRRALEALPDD